MTETRFKPEAGVSYSAGVAFVSLEKKVPSLVLVLQHAGEKNPQKEGGFFVEERTWKMSMGHFDALNDASLEATAIREFAEETVLTFSKTALDAELSVSIRIPSERPGAEFHEDVFFLVVADKKPRAAKGIVRDKVVECAEWFPLSALPSGDGARDHGAAMAFGHRKKLARLFLACQSKKTRDGLEIRKVLAAMIPK